MGNSKRIFNLFLKLWPLGKWINQLLDWPPLGRLTRPLLRNEGNRAVIIPVNQVVRQSQSVVLPFPLLTPLIDRASHRAVLDGCLCRQVENCQQFPHDFGCLFLGDGAARIHPSVGRPVSREEALAHVGQGLQLGLVPLIVHNTIDSWMLGIPYRRMLAICFCCDCCCTVRQILRRGPAAFWAGIQRLPGLSVEVTPACQGCGTCVPLCPAGAISLRDGRAHIDERCKGCGRCVSACPAGAVRLLLDERVDVLAQLLALVQSCTAITSVEHSG